MSDYVHFVRQPDTAYLFEEAARELAQQVNADGDGVHVFVDRRYREGWPSLSFLLAAPDAVNWFSPQSGLAAPVALPATIYAWPYESLAFVLRDLEPPVLVSVAQGALARGDLEPQPYPLYVRFEAHPRQSPAPRVVFDGRYALHGAAVTMLDARRVQLELTWSVGDADPAGSLPTAFVHVVPQGSAGDAPPLGQSDGPLAHGYWPGAAWQPGQLVRERRIIDMQEPLDLTRHEIVVGLYDAATNDRLPALSPQGEPLGDFWLLSSEPRAHEEN